MNDDCFCGTNSLCACYCIERNTGEVSPEQQAGRTITDRCQIQMHEIKLNTSAFIWHTSLHKMCEWVTFLWQKQAVQLVHQLELKHFFSQH